MFHIADGDGLTPSGDPARRHHDGKNVDQIAKHLEAGRSGTDHDTRSQLDDFDTRRRKCFPDGMPATQVDTEIVAITPQPAEVDDSPQPGLGRMPGEAESVSLLGECPVTALPDRVHQVHGDVDSTERLGHVVADRPGNHLYSLPPGRAVQLRRGPDQTPHIAAGGQQRGDKSAADITRCAGYQYSQVTAREVMLGVCEAHFRSLTGSPAPLSATPLDAGPDAQRAVPGAAAPGDAGREPSAVVADRALRSPDS